MLSRAIVTVVLAAVLVSPCSAFDTGSLDPTDFYGQLIPPDDDSAHVSPVFQDVLDAPSRTSKLAAKTLVNGFARAGTRLVSVGERGHILYSDDQGKNWTQASVPVSTVLTAVHFPSPKKGWAVGHEGVVLHSLDGGATWKRQFDGRAAVQVMSSYYTSNAVLDPKEMDVVKRFVAEGPDKPFLDVWFESETTGFIVGAFNLIFQTTDGGKSWIPWFHRTENPNHFHLFAINRVEQELYLCGEQGMVLKFDRKTGRFQAANVPYKGTLFGITGKAGALVAFGLRGNVFLSRNGGAKWQELESGVEAGLMSGTVTEDGRIVLASALGQVIVSNDNGASFELIKQEHLKPASAVISLDKDKLALGGLFGVQVVSVK